MKEEERNKKRQEIKEKMQGEIEQGKGKDEKERKTGRNGIRRKQTRTKTNIKARRKEI